MLHIASVERDTGISKDVLRKWESRYHFPNPVRMADGDRYYPKDQVERLRTIKRLLDAGFRPGMVVPAEPAELCRLAAELSVTTPHAVAADTYDAAFACLARHDIVGLDRLLRGQLAKQGLTAFVLETLGPMTESVGEAWAEGRIQVHHEHAYADVVQTILRGVIAGLGSPSEASPCLVLATPSGELHTLGILMAQAVFALHGARTIQLGQQVPVADIVDAVARYRADIVGLSFSHAYAPRQARQLLQELGRSTDPEVEIWAGGRAVSRFGKLPAGVIALPEMTQAIERLEAQCAHAAMGS